MSGPLDWASRSVFAPPRHRLVCIRRSAEQPVTLDEAVLHLRLDPEAANGPERSLIAGYIVAATQALENYASCAVMEQDWRMTLAHWPWVSGDGLPIPRPPLTELLRIRINYQAQALSDYIIEHDEYQPAVLFPAAGSWSQPSGYAHDGVIIEYRCGQADPDNVAAPLKQAVLMAVATWYENRESLQQFTLTPMLELGWAPLLARYREVGFA